MSIISAKNVSKQYDVSPNDCSTFREKYLHSFNGLLGKKNLGKNSINDFWALRNISFDVEKGEVFGIIGLNGAGKSTLLKILAQITPLTSGQIRIEGRIGALLEVGTGFNPELTGKENIFLNGALLGMSYLEIKKNFNEIVEFSGVEKFLNIPVKRYSSGMYVRLAFSVAAHLSSDILLVDEVLAVGDMNFQKKCLGKMDEITKKSGRTIIFVSHNLSVMQSLCSRCILLDRGEVKSEGDVSRVVNDYYDLCEAGIEKELIDRKDRSGNGKVRINNFQILSQDGKNIKSFDELIIRIDFDDNFFKFSNCQLKIGFYTNEMTPLFRIESEVISIESFKEKQIIITSGKINIASQRCWINIALFIDGEISDHIKNIKSFEIMEGSAANIKNFNKRFSTVLIGAYYKY